MKKSIFGIACAATMIFGSVFMTGARAQESLEREEPTHKIDSNNPYVCELEFAWDCIA